MMTKFRKRLQGSAGFTLVELIVVIAVLGILAGIAIPRLTGVSDKARLSEGETLAGSIKQAQAMNMSEYGSYIDPSNLDAFNEYVNLDEFDDNWAISGDPTVTSSGYTIVLIGDNDAEGFSSNLTVTVSEGGISTSK